MPADFLLGEPRVWLSYEPSCPFSTHPPECGPRSRTTWQPLLSASSRPLPPSERSRDLSAGTQLRSLDLNPIRCSEPQLLEQGLLSPAPNPTNWGSGLRVLYLMESWIRQKRCYLSSVLSTSIYLILSMARAPPSSLGFLLKHHLTRPSLTRPQTPLLLRSLVFLLRLSPPDYSFFCLLRVIPLLAYQLP